MDPMQRPLLAPADGNAFQDLSRRLTRENRNQHVADLPTGLSALVNALFWLTIPCCSCCCGGFTVTNTRKAILSRCGIITDVMREPGVYGPNPCCLDVTEVDYVSWTKEINALKINDSTGIPVWVSAVYCYQLNDTIDSQYKVHDVQRFIKDQAKVALMKVLSKYPYDRHPNERGPCLRYQSDQMERELYRALNDAINDAGWCVTSFRITGIGISDNMQKLTLARQIAQSYVTGKKTIAEGAMGIVEKTVISLRKRGLELTEQERDALVTDLIYMICNNDNFALKLNKIEQ